MSKDKIEEDEVYGPPNDDHILPDNFKVPVKASN